MRLVALPQAAGQSACAYAKPAAQTSTVACAEPAAHQAHCARAASGRGLEEALSSLKKCAKELSSAIRGAFPNVLDRLNKTSSMPHEQLVKEEVVDSALTQYQEQVLDRICLEEELRSEQDSFNGGSSAVGGSAGPTADEPRGVVFSPGRVRLARPASSRSRRTAQSPTTSKSPSPSKAHALTSSKSAPSMPRNQSIAPAPKSVSTILLSPDDSSLLTKSGWLTSKAQAEEALDSAALELQRQQQHITEMRRKLGTAVESVAASEALATAEEQQGEITSAKELATSELQAVHNVLLEQLGKTANARKALLDATTSRARVRAMRRRGNSGSKVCGPERA